MEKILSPKSINNYSIYLICFVPISLVMGPLIAEINMFIINALFIFSIIKNKEYIFFRNNYFYLFLVAWIYLIILSLISYFVLFSLKSSFFFLRFGIFYLALCYFFSKSEENFQYKKKAPMILFFFIILLLFDAVFQKFFNSNILGQIPASNRISSFFGDELVLGGYIARLLPTIFAIFYFFKIEKIIKLLPLIWIISIIVVIFSGEKAGFAQMIISTFLIIIFSARSIKIKIYSILTTTLLIIGLFYSAPNLQKRLVKDYIYNTHGGKYLYSIMHNRHFSTAIRMFYSKPFLGYGPKNFRNHCADKKFYSGEWSCSTHPHNIYLQLLSETGIIFFSLIIFIFLYSSFKLLLLFKERFLYKEKDHLYNFKLFSTVGVFINLFPLSTSGNFFNNWFSIILFFVFSFFLISNRNTKYL